MNLFGEQIKERKIKDQDLFEDSILKMASAVSGERISNDMRDRRIVTRDAIDDILKYYHIRPAEIPVSIESPEEQLEYALRPHGFMHRTVELRQGWEKDAYGPMIAFRSEDGIPVAVFPNAFSGYWYRDENGHKKKVDKGAKSLFDNEAICFYRPLPLRSLGTADLLKFIRQSINGYDVFCVVLMILLYTLFGMLVPRLILFLTDFVTTQGNISILIGTGIFLLVVYLSSGLIGMAKRLSLNRILIKSDNAVEAAVMMRIISLPAPFFKDYSSGELANRRQSIQRLCALIINNIFFAGLMALASLLYLVQVFGIAPGLFGPSVMILLFMIVFTLILVPVQSGTVSQKMESSAKEEGLSYSIISGVRKIKLAGAEKRAFAKWADAYTDSARLSYDPPILIKLSKNLVLAISLFGTIVLYYRAVATGVSPAEYMAFNAAFGVLMAAFIGASGMVASIARIRPILKMAEPILKAEPETCGGKEILTGISGGIELNNVYFRYSEDMPYILKGLNLKIRPGEYVAIVGKTGCGKSTLVRLLLGFESPERGAIYYDGKDMSRIDLRSLRKKIGAVTQDGGLFQGDIYRNIVISAPELGMDAAWEAAELAGIADDIRSMPMGMNTIIGEGQGGISGGQRQRLMIARAVVTKPKILIFDEATSSLDNITQKQVSDTLDTLGCTRLVIAHRLSTIKNCDRILVLEDGNIIEDGKYDELMEKKGFFADLVERQMN